MLQIMHKRTKIDMNQKKVGKRAVNCIFFVTFASLFFK